MMTRIELQEKKLAQTIALFQNNKDKWMTAIQINQAINTADARKKISLMIQKGYPIEKKIINKENGTKAYRLVYPYRIPPKQLSLF